MRFCKYGLELGVQVEMLFINFREVHPVRMLKYSVNKFRLRIYFRIKFTKEKKKRAEKKFRKNVNKAAVWVVSKRQY